ncbi:MAG: hypothetical protein LBL65_04965 [Campylobacteraceae bacterium]|jgi:hypothetical protein|nr:hypothetical protein [Campylobacteraceae bacterium]
MVDSTLRDNLDFIEHMHIKDDSHNFVINPIAFGRYEFEFKLSSDDKEYLEGAIASFEFNKESELLEGLFKSQVKNMGYFRYLQTSRDGAITKFIIDIPQDVELNKIKIIPWSAKTIPIFLDDIKVTKQHDKITLSVSADDTKIYASIAPFQDENYAFYVIRNDEVIYRQTYTSQNSFEFMHDKILGRHRVKGYARSKNGLTGRGLSQDMFVFGQERPLENISKDKLRDTYLLIKSGNYSFHCLYFEGKVNNLFVLLSGAIDRNKRKPPYFTRWKWRDKFPGHIICISDPTLLLNETIELGWYIGSEKYNATDDMAKLVKHIAKILGVPNERIISYGSSGGGFGALMLASKIDGSLAVAINPQTNVLSHYQRVEKMVDVCFSGRDQEFIEKNYNDRICVQKALKNSNSRVFIIQNTLDEFHWKNHYPPFAKEMELPLVSGISKNGKHKAIIYNDPKGHGEESSEIFAEIIRNIDEILNNDTIKIFSSQSKKAINTYIEFDEKIYNLTFELIEMENKKSMYFMQDCIFEDGTREIIALNYNRTAIYSSFDVGLTWQLRYISVKWLGRIITVFTTSFQEKLVWVEGGYLYHFDGNEQLMALHNDRQYPWHGSQGIGESENGVIMYAEYCSKHHENEIIPLNVWRYRFDTKEWKKIFTLQTTMQPNKEIFSDIRHFHICRPNPLNKNQWILSTGDKDTHCRMWISSDEGDNWQELTNFKPAPKSPYTNSNSVFRFVQYAVTINGDLIWGTDDTNLSTTRQSAIIKMSIKEDRKQSEILTWLGDNCIRNIISCGNDIFLLLSEAKTTIYYADCFLYHLRTNKLVHIPLPMLNNKTTKSGFTYSFGSTMMVNNAAFVYTSYILTKENRGIIKISFNEIEQNDKRI